MQIKIVETLRFPRAAVPLNQEMSPAVIYVNPNWVRGMLGLKVGDPIPWPANVDRDKSLVAAVVRHEIRHLYCKITGFQAYKGQKKRRGDALLIEESYCNRGFWNSLTEDEAIRFIADMKLRPTDPLCLLQFGISDLLGMFINSGMMVNVDNDHLHWMHHVLCESSYRYSMVSYGMWIEAAEYFLEHLPPSARVPGNGNEGKPYEDLVETDEKNEASEPAPSKEEEESDGGAKGADKTKGKEKVWAVKSRWINPTLRDDLKKGMFADVGDFVKAKNSLKAEIIADTYEDFDQSIVPEGAMSSRDYAIRQGGYEPMFYDTPQPKGSPVVYVDTSGSLEYILPYVLDLAAALAGEGIKVYTFSTSVMEAPAFVCGGTSFDSVLEHAMSRGYEEVTIVTDNDDHVSTTPRGLRINLYLVGGRCQDSGGLIPFSQKKKFINLER